MNDSYREGRREMKERASCWRSPCENGSVTENRLLPFHAFPEQSTLQGQGSSWGNIPKRSVSGLAPLEFIHVVTKRSVADGWMAEILSQYLHFPPPAHGDYCVFPSLMVPQLFGCLYEQPTLTNSSQGHKTLNCLTLLQIITMTTSTAWKEKWDRVAGVQHSNVTDISELRQYFSGDMGY